MLQKERQAAILEMLNQRKSISVKEISELFQITKETVRKDLDYLEGQNLISRIHGGAVRVPSLDSLTRPEIPYYERENICTKEKHEIAKLAAQHIHEGDRIFLDASSSSVFLARELPDIQLFVLTNSVRIFEELSRARKIDVYSPGGVLLRSSMCFVGEEAVASILHYHVGKAFLSCRGITGSGVSESNALAISVKKKILTICDEVYLLMDHTKFNIQDFLQVTSLDNVAHIITDGMTTDDQIALLGIHSQKVIRSSNDNISFNGNKNECPAGR
jgi:DeoR/GlpR family transcriptional regulator of sugar metabolism